MRPPEVVTRYSVLTLQREENVNARGSRENICTKWLVISLEIPLSTKSSSRIAITEVLQSLFLYLWEMMCGRRNKVSLL